jgi:hypothetical protein
MNVLDHGARSAVLGLAAGLAIGAGAVAVATGALPITNGVVTECRTTSHNSLLRIGNANGSCPKGQSAIRFNATGPRGSTGAPGAPGATGATGPPGPTGIGIVDGYSYGSSPISCYSTMLCSNGSVTPGGGFGPTWLTQLTTAAQYGPWECSIISSTGTTFSYGCSSPDPSATAPVIIWWVKAP